MGSFEKWLLVKEIIPQMIVQKINQISKKTKCQFSYLSKQQEIMHIVVRGIILACIRNLNRCEILIFSIAFRYITFQKRSKFYCYFIGKLKSATRNETKVTLRLSFNFTHKLSQTNRHVCSRCKALMNHSSAQIELSRTKNYKILQSG